MSGPGCTCSKENKGNKLALLQYRSHDSSYWRHVFTHIVLILNINVYSAAIYGWIYAAQYST